MCLLSTHFRRFRSGSCDVLTIHNAVFHRTELCFRTDHHTNINCIKCIFRDEKLILFTFHYSTISYESWLKSVIHPERFIIITIIRSYVIIFSTGPQRRWFHGLKRTTRDSIAVQSHARPYQSSRHNSGLSGSILVDIVS